MSPTNQLTININFLLSITSPDFVPSILYNHHNLMIGGVINTYVIIDLLCKLSPECATYFIGTVSDSIKTKYYCLLNVYTVYDNVSNKTNLRSCIWHCSFCPGLPLISISSRSPQPVRTPMMSEKIINNFM